MTTTRIVLLVLAAIVGVLYILRRRARLAKED
jgi:hypothetical protein